MSLPRTTRSVRTILSTPSGSIRWAVSCRAISPSSLRALHTSLRREYGKSVIDEASKDEHLLTKRLADELRLPLFSASGEQLHLLEDPSHFYQTLKDKISQAENRIFLASLYIGKEESELIEHLESALCAKPSLQLTILVDALRGTRESAPTPSCASLVSRLRARFPDRVRIRLYHTPNLKGWLKKFVGKRFNEGWGLQHMKIYGFDNDVVLSGANLSRDYFTNRRDRYLMIEDHEDIANYLHSLVQLVGQFSFKLEACEDRGASFEKEESPDWKLIWDGGKDSTSSLRSQTEMQPYRATGWTDEAANAVEEFTRQWNTICPISKAEIAIGRGQADTLLLPLLQMGPLKIRQETCAIPQILELAHKAHDEQGPPPILALTSGYFSLYKPYKALLLQAKAARTAVVKMICAAPEANGFFNSKGVSGWIPEAYTWYEFQFWDALRRSRRLLRQDGKSGEEGGVEIREWKKDGWTYHAKGIWFSPPPAEGSNELAAPTIVHIGSSNYGSRSADLDLECTFLISTLSKKLSQKFKEEWSKLEADAKDRVDESLFQRPDRQVRRRVRIASWILKGML
ncbi:CDP-diacylglycerol--glycerol-3-phosphate 3-phosphatidyltransferase [Mycosarcoma maydis]|uniref:CDP-diacylglycerol--glycerol-3-phosphate 3-phosphatidyltransferase n=1 Tax=Mycosarcoma maydis TaxID=5270 RepID=A0A0D1E9Z8_MYCMD|nr:CDP-diacylglycerol--glycerol-3-phosphate 3-phosphatidyltransferase [Ustilago maydis 521]KIS71215.1 hypothetical protein UMAG_01120 [Ustilago maydis 521]|eukprot:XP_011387073.1 hypothetical protein UMAG_01120 [Ustilago maydis 521]